MAIAIDADELIEFLNTDMAEEACDDFEWRLIETVINKVNAMSAVEAEPVKHGKWISVKDRLPDLDNIGSVWISDTVLAAHHGVMICFGYFKKRTENGPIEFVGYDDDFDEHRDEYPEDLEMTHWMPLPELPKEG